MTSHDEWQIVFYLDEAGQNPIGDFLEQLDQKTRTRFAWSIEQLRLRNVQAKAPLVKPIEGKLWELQEESKTNIYRVFYFFFTGRQIVLVHGFQKKTEKTPKHEIELAKKRMESFIKRTEGGE